MALDLDDPAWSRLTTAYGPATDIPSLLRAAYQRRVPEEAWDALWSALCHQHDIYTATYAALPHLVAAARGRPVLEQAPYFHLVAFATACAARPGSPGLPLELAEHFADALSEASALARQGLGERPIDREAVKILCATVAAARGDADLAIDFLEAGEPLTCPHCGGSVPPPSDAVLAEA